MLAAKDVHVEKGSTIQIAAQTSVAEAQHQKPDDSNEIGSASERAAHPSAAELHHPGSVDQSVGPYEKGGSVQMSSQMSAVEPQHHEPVDQSVGPNQKGGSVKTDSQTSVAHPLYGARQGGSVRGDEKKRSTAKVIADPKELLDMAREAFLRADDELTTLEKKRVHKVRIYRQVTICAVLFCPHLCSPLTGFNHVSAVSDYRTLCRLLDPLGSPY